MAPEPSASPELATRAEPRMAGKEEGRRLAGLRPHPDHFRRGVEVAEGVFRPAIRSG